MAQVQVRMEEGELETESRRLLKSFVKKTDIEMGQ